MNGTLLYAILGSAGAIVAVVILGVVILAVLMNRRHRQLAESKSYQSLITTNGTSMLQSRRGSALRTGVVSGSRMSTAGGYHPVENAAGGLGTLGLYNNRRTSAGMSSPQTVIAERTA